MAQEPLVRISMQGEEFAVRESFVKNGDHLTRVLKGYINTGDGRGVLVEDIYFEIPENIVEVRLAESGGTWYLQDENSPKSWRANTSYPESELD